MVRRSGQALLCGLLFLTACSKPPAHTDGGVDAGIGLTCAKLLQCDQACSGPSTCTDACFSKSTMYAQEAFNTFSDCIAFECPSTAGGPCAEPDSNACSQCNEAAGTGACIKYLLLCENDRTVGSPNPDGGTGELDGGFQVDAGVGVNCGPLLTCEENCAVGDTACQAGCYGGGTSTAQALSLALGNCVDSVCPSTDGGPCATAGTTCNGCRQQADFNSDDGGCGVPFTACEDDTSASSDGGIEPIPLQGGTVTTLATGLSQPQVVLIQDGYAYFSEITATGPVLDVPIDGGTVSTLSPSQPYPMGLAIDSNNIYAWNSGSFSGSSALNNNDGTVVQIPLDGGTPSTLATGMAVAYDAPYLNAIAVDNTAAYWVTGGPGTTGTIERAVPGGVGSTLYSSQNFPQAIVSDGTTLYWGDWGTYDGQGNYNNDGTVVSAPASSAGTITILASGQSAPAAMAVDGNNVYWTNIGQVSAGGFPQPGTGSVMQVSLNGSHLVTLASQQDIPLGIAVEGSTVYWAEFTLSSPGAILSTPVGGGTITTLVANVKDPFGLTVSNGVVYWTDNIPTGIGDGVLLKLTP